MLVLDPPDWSDLWADEPVDEASQERAVKEALKEKRYEEVAAILIDLAFIYLARLADLLACACPPVLFGRLGCSSARMSAFRAEVADPAALARLRPLAPPESLSALFAEGAPTMKWFDDLKGSDTGFRDALVHGTRWRMSRWVQLSSYDPATDPPPTLHAYALKQTPQGRTSDGVSELLAGLRTCYTGFCDFLTESPSSYRLGRWVHRRRSTAGLRGPSSRSPLLARNLRSRPPAR